MRASTWLTQSTQVTAAIPATTNVPANTASLQAPAQEREHDRGYPQHGSDVPQILVKQRPEADLERGPQPVEVRDDAVVCRIGSSGREAMRGEPDSPWQHQGESDEPGCEETWPEPAPFGERGDESREQHAGREEHPLTLRQHRAREEHSRRGELPGFSSSIQRMTRSAATAMR